MMSGHGSARPAVALALAEARSAEQIGQIVDRVYAFTDTIQNLGFIDFDDFKKTKASMSPEEFGKLCLDLIKMARKGEF